MSEGEHKAVRVDSPRSEIKGQTDREEGWRDRTAGIIFTIIQTIVTTKRALAISPNEVYFEHGAIVRLNKNVIKHGGRLLPQEASDTITVIDESLR